jgi:hypothetical protein
MVAKEMYPDAASDNFTNTQKKAVKAGVISYSN